MQKILDRFDAVLPLYMQKCPGRGSVWGMLN